MNPDVPTWAGVAASATLAALAILVAWRGRLHLARDIAIAAAQAAVQLAAVIGARLAERALFDNAHPLRHLTTPTRSAA